MQNCRINIFDCNKNHDLEVNSEVPAYLKTKLNCYHTSQENDRNFYLCKRKLCKTVIKAYMLYQLANVCQFGCHFSVTKFPVTSYFEAIFKLCNKTDILHMVTLSPLHMIYSYKLFFKHFDHLFIRKS